MCVDCDETVVYINKGSFIEISVGDVTTISTNKSIFKIFKNMYHENIRKVIYEFLFAVVKTEPNEGIYYSPILTDFYYDILDMLDSDKKQSCFLQFKTFTIFVDNIDGVKFYKI